MDRKQFREVADDARARRGERVADGEARSLDVELGAIDRAERPVEAELLLAVDGILPGLQRGDHLRGERLVDLVEVEVLQRQSGARDHAGHRHGGGHQQAFAVHKVDGRVLRVRDVGEDGQAALGRPLLRGQQHAGRAVGERRGVGCGEGRALALVEGRAQRRDLFQADVVAQVVVAIDAGEGDDEIVHPALAVGGGGLVVALVGELVLLLAGDAPILGHQLRVLAHGQARARLARGGRQRRQLGQRQALEGAEPHAEGLGVLRLDEALGKLLLEDDGRIRRGVGADGDAALDLARGDLGGDGAGRLQARAAGLLHGHAGRGGREPRIEHGLARKVPVARVGDDGAARHLVDVQAGEVVLLHETVEGRRHHVEVRLVGVERVGPAEGNADGADHGGLAQARLLHHAFSIGSLKQIRFWNGSVTVMSRMPQGRSSIPGRLYLYCLARSSALKASSPRMRTMTLLPGVPSPWCSDRCSVTAPRVTCM